MKLSTQLIIWPHIILPALCFLLTPTLIMGLAKAQQQRAKLMANALSARARTASALARNNAKFQQKRFMPSARFQPALHNANYPFHLRTIRDTSEQLQYTPKNHPTESRSHLNQEPETMISLQNLWNMRNFGEAPNTEDTMRQVQQRDRRDSKFISSQDKTIIGNPRIYLTKKNSPHSPYFSRNVFDAIVSQGNPVTNEIRDFPPKEMNDEFGSEEQFENFEDPASGEELERTHKKSKKNKGHHSASYGPHYGYEPYGSYSSGGYYRSSENPEAILMNAAFDTVEARKSKKGHSHGHGYSNSYYGRESELPLDFVPVEPILMLPLEAPHEAPLNPILISGPREIEARKSKSKKGHPHGHYSNQHYGRESALPMIMIHSEPLLPLQDPLNPTVIAGPMEARKSKKGHSRGHGNSGHHYRRESDLPEEMVQFEPNLMLPLGADLHTEPRTHNKKSKKNHGYSNNYYSYPSGGYYGRNSEVAPIGAIDTRDFVALTPQNEPQAPIYSQLQPIPNNPEQEINNRPLSQNKEPILATQAEARCDDDDDNQKKPAYYTAPSIPPLLDPQVYYDRTVKEVEKFNKKLAKATKSLQFHPEEDIFHIPSGVSPHFEPVIQHYPDKSGEEYEEYSVGEKSADPHLLNHGRVHTFTHSHTHTHGVLSNNNGIISGEGGGFGSGNGRGLNGFGLGGGVNQAGINGLGNGGFGVGAGGLSQAETQAKALSNANGFGLGGGLNQAGINGGFGLGAGGLSQAEAQAKALSNANGFGLGGGLNQAGFNGGFGVGAGGLSQAEAQAKALSNANGFGLGGGLNQAGINGLGNGGFGLGAGSLSQAEAEAKALSNANGFGLGGGLNQAGINGGFGVDAGGLSQAESQAKALSNANGFGLGGGLNHRGGGAFGVGGGLSQAEAQAKALSNENGFGLGGVLNRGGAGALGVGGGLSQGEAQAKALSNTHGFGITGGLKEASAQAQAKAITNSGFGPVSSLGGGLAQAEAAAQASNAGFGQSQANAQAVTQSASNGFGQSASQALAQANAGSHTGGPQFFQVLGPSNFVNTRSSKTGPLDEIPVSEPMHEMKVGTGRFSRDQRSGLEEFSGLKMASKIVNSALGLGSLLPTHKDQGGLSNKDVTQSGDKELKLASGIMDIIAQNGEAEKEGEQSFRLKRKTDMNFASTTVSSAPESMFHPNTEQKQGQNDEQKAEHASGVVTPESHGFHHPDVGLISGKDERKIKTVTNFASTMVSSAPESTFQPNTDQKQGQNKEQKGEHVSGVVTPGSHGFHNQDLSGRNEKKGVVQDHEENGFKELNFPFVLEHSAKSPMSTPEAMDIAIPAPKKGNIFQQVFRDLDLEPGTMRSIESPIFEALEEFNSAFPMERREELWSPTAQEVQSDFEPSNGKEANSKVDITTTPFSALQGEQNTGSLVLHINQQQPLDVINNTSNNINENVVSGHRVSNGATIQPQIDSARQIISEPKETGLVGSTIILKDDSNEEATKETTTVNYDNEMVETKSPGGINVKGVKQNVQPSTIENAKVEHKLVHQPNSYSTEFDSNLKIASGVGLNKDQNDGIIGLPHQEDNRKIEDSPISAPIVDFSQPGLVSRIGLHDEHSQEQNGKKIQTNDPQNQRLLTVESNNKEHSNVDLLSTDRTLILEKGVHKLEHSSEESSEEKTKTNKDGELSKPTTVVLANGTQSESALTLSPEQIEEIQFSLPDNRTATTEASQSLNTDVTVEPPVSKVDSNSSLASLEADMSRLSDEQKDAFIRQEGGLIAEILAQHLDYDGILKSRGTEDVKESTTDKTLSSPHLIQAFDKFGEWEKSHPEFLRQSRQPVETLDAILGAQREEIGKIQKEATGDDDLLMISYIGDSMINDLENRAQQAMTEEPITNRLKRELMPVSKLLLDPKRTIDVPQTLDNVGAVVKHTFESPKAPMYHVRNMLGNTKNTIMSAAKVPPNNIIVPSQYEVAKLGEDPQLGAINQEMLNIRGINAQLANEDSTPGVVDTFKKIGGIVKQSVDNGKNVVVHGNDMVTDAKNAIYTAQHSIPRLLLPTQILATRSSFLPGISTLNHPVLLAPKLLDLQDLTLGQQPQNLLGIGHILDALGLSNPEQTNIKLKKFVLEPSPIGFRLKAEPPGEEELELDEVKKNLESLDETEKSVGAKNLKDFFNKMHQEMKEILTSQQEERKRKREEKLRSSKSKLGTNKEYILGKKKSAEATPSKSTLQKLFEENQDVQLPPEVLKAFIDDIPKQADDLEFEKSQTTPSNDLEKPTTDATLGLYLIPALMHPFMGEAPHELVNDFLRENGDESMLERNSVDNDRKTQVYPIIPLNLNVTIPGAGGKPLNLSDYLPKPPMANDWLTATENTSGGVNEGLINKGHPLDRIDEEQLGHVLGAINPLMFERHVKDSLKLKKPLDETAPKKDGLVTEKAENTLTPPQLSKNTDKNHENILTIPKDTSVPKAAATLDENPMENESQNTPTERISMIVADTYKKPFMGLSSAKKIRHFLDQYNSNDAPNSEVGYQFTDPVKDAVYGGEDYNYI